MVAKDIPRFYLSPTPKTKIWLSPKTKVPLRELRDPASDAKEPRRYLAYLCVR